ncbi:hypothetical protein D3C80_1530020 [compost metagenome]
MRFSCGKNIVVSYIFLQNPPHSLDIVARMTPVTASVKIAKPQLFLKSSLNCCNCACDLACDEGFAAQRTFMVEQDAIGGMKAIGLTIVDCCPVSKKLSGRIWALRGEWRLFTLCVW